ncbi:beta-alanine-activating enzyme isoform X1 [Hydra vulgaris]|uniref:Beta-alanine-activating enzyme isoform X1 n=1 Tax=Hydra vulgaris TaxID=6087 RepID=A0ABM4CKC0_HYDVU
MQLKNILNLKPSDHIAVIFDDGNQCDTMSYKQFLFEAQQAKVELKSKISSEPSVIGILCPQSVYTPLLVYICLHTENPFLTLSLDSNSLISTLKNCNVQYIIVHKNILPQISGVLKIFVEKNVPISSLGGLYTILALKLDINNDISNGFTYIVQSSGTTGTPKTIFVPEKCFVPNLIDFLNLFNMQESDIIFVSSALTFDASIIQIFLGWCSFSTLLVVTDNLRSHPEKISKCLEKHRVTFLQCTPSFLGLIGDHFQEKHLFHNGSKLKTLVLGGESFPSKEKCVKWIKALPQLRIFNLYGTSEVSAWASIYEVTNDQFNTERQTLDSDWVPIGKPLSKTIIEVNDFYGKALKHGLGKIWIGSEERVCRIPELKEPTLSSCIMRATGDLGFKEGEQIYYSGRYDDQIKRNGLYVSTIHITNIVKNIPGVKDCFSTVDKEVHNILIVYYVPENDIEVNIFEFMLTRYPPQYIPDKIVSVDCFPLTMHGKIDKNTLRKKLEKVFKGSLNDVVRSITKSWNEALKISPQDSVSAEIEFSTLGGNSFIAAYLVNKILDFFPYQINFEEIFIKVLTSSLNQFIHFISSYVYVDVESNIEDKASCFVKFDGEGCNCFDKDRCFCNKLEKCNCFTAFLKAHTIQTCLCSKKYSGFQNSIFLTSKFNISLNLEWHFDAQKCVDASPLIVFYENSSDGIVYIGSHSYIFVALNLKNGNLLWRQILGGRIESSAIVSPDGKFICVGCYDGFIYALHCGTGEIYYKFKTNDIVKCTPTPYKKHGLIIVGSYDKHIYALDVSQKVCKWKIKFNGSCFATPLVIDEQNSVVVALLSGTLSSVNAETGEKIWEINFINKPLFSSPTLCRKFILIGCVDGNLYAIDFNGRKLWSYTTKAPIFSSPLIIYEQETFIFIGSNDQIIYCLNEQGFLLWKYKTSSSIFSSPTVLHVSSLENNMLQLEISVVILVLSTDGHVHALKFKYYPQSDLQSKLSIECAAKIKSKDTLVNEKIPIDSTERLFVSNTSVIEVSCIDVYKFPAEVFSSPIVCKNKIIVGCRDNYIYCMNIEL